MGIWGHMGGIWELHGKHVGGMWEAYKDASDMCGKYIRGIWEVHGRYMGGI